MKKNRFLGRTVAVVRDLSLDERLYLFEKAREVKEMLKKQDQKGLEKYRIDDKDYGIYEVFLEDSTRTKESFKNAAEFHRIKLNSLDAGHSSFNKSESYADTFNTLTGYNNSIFVIRSKLEGVCRWLETNGEAYAKRHGIATPPAFINAGDGKHEHPTQELLDEFTFLEQNNWKRDTFHVALVGDLFHGRTVHSKVDGLTIFDQVFVDLIAPPELAMPEYYVRRMKTNGYTVRIFESIAEYFAQKNIAKSWYFTRPQLERMGDDILKRQHELRDKIVFKKEYIDYIPAGTMFYHPLPRHKKHPTIPFFLDDTPLNGWENQSHNGKVTRIVLLAMIAGKLDDDYQGPAEIKQTYDESFIEEVSVPPSSESKEYAEGVNPISNGVVIDHICRGESEREIREHMGRIIHVMKLYGKGGEWVSASRIAKNAKKGIIFRPGHPEFDKKEMKQLAAIAPGCTVNIIIERQVMKKLRLHMPPRIYNFDTISCRNAECISHPLHEESIPADFFRVDGDLFVCKYCEKPHSFKEIWK